MLLNPTNPSGRNSTSVCNHTSVSVSPGSTQILPANIRRNWFMIQNNGNSTIYLNFSTTAAVATGIEIEVNAVFVGTADMNYTGDISAISISEVVECRVVEALK